MDKTPSKSRLVKSRSGCSACKQRRVKCDERYPICGNCSRRNNACVGIAPPQIWQEEIPQVFGLTSESVGIRILPKQRRILSHWFQRTCRVLCIASTRSNPLFLGLLPQIQESSALLHSILSIGAAHQALFAFPKMQVCFEERGKALADVRKEISEPTPLKTSTFIAILLLGYSTGWINGVTQDFGFEHLQGARLALTTLMNSSTARQDPYFYFAVGLYVYWDMSCSYLSPHSMAIQPVPGLMAVLKEMRQRYPLHSITGISVEICYTLGLIGRYCRKVLDTGRRNLLVEENLRESLTAVSLHSAEPVLADLAGCFRRAGIIMLNCFNDSTLSSLEDVTAAEQIIDSLASNELLNLTFVTIPLWIACSVLRREDEERRKKAEKILMESYSFQGLEVNLYCLKLIKEAWGQSDDGLRTSWLQCMLRKKWTVMLG